MFKLPKFPKRRKTYVSFKDGHMHLDVNAYLKTKAGQDAVRRACGKSVCTCSDNMSILKPCTAHYSEHENGAIQRTGKLPCPFCGSDAQHVYMNLVGDPHYRICCTNRTCDTQGPRAPIMTDDDAVAWNTRTKR